MTTTAADVQEAREALEAKDHEIHELRRSRQRLRDEVQAASAALEEATTARRRALEGAVAAGDEDTPELQEARDAVRSARDRHEEARERVEALDRILEERKEEARRLQDAAERAHRAYWKARREEYLEQARDAVGPLLRAYKASQAGSPSPVGLREWLSGEGLVSDGALLELGLTSGAAERVEMDDPVPVRPPRARNT